MQCWTGSVPNTQRHGDGRVELPVDGALAKVCIRGWPPPRDLSGAHTSLIRSVPSPSYGRADGGGVWLQRTWEEKGWKVGN